MDYSVELGLDNIDRDSILETLSLDLMRDNIQQQITYSITSTTDFLSVVIDKFNMILSMDEIEEDDKTEVKHQIVDFCEDIIQSIANQFNLFINTPSNDYQSLMELLNTLYHFFILDRCNNVERFLINYIDKNKSDLVSLLQLDDRNRDITSISNKKKNFSKENVCMLAALNQVIQFISSNQLVDPVEFIDIVDDGEVYTTYMKDYYTDTTVTGDFTIILLKEVLNDDYDGSEVARIRNNVRMSLYESNN